MCTADSIFCVQAVSQMGYFFDFFVHTAEGASGMDSCGFPGFPTLPACRVSSSNALMSINALSP